MLAYKWRRIRTGGRSNLSICLEANQSGKGGGGLAFLELMGKRVFTTVFNERIIMVADPGQPEI